MTDLPLFDRPPPFPHGVKTARQAAKAVEPLVGNMRDRVLRLISDRGNQGATDEEVHQALGLRPDTARARRVELRDDRLVLDSRRVRPTSSGHPAIVWIASLQNGEASGPAIAARPTIANTPAAIAAGPPPPAAAAGRLSDSPDAPPIAADQTVPPAAASLPATGTWRRSPARSTDQEEEEDLFSPTRAQNQHPKGPLAGTPPRKEPNPGVGGLGVGGGEVPTADEPGTSQNAHQPAIATPAAPRPIAPPPGEHFLPDRCPKCKSVQFRDVPIHDGRSRRRDCRKCGLTIGFPLWYGCIFSPHPLPTAH